MAGERLRALAVADIRHAEVRLGAEKRYGHAGADLAVGFEVVVRDAVGPGAIPGLVEVPVFP